MMGSTFTFLIGSESSAPFFNSKNENLNAEEVYGCIMTPIFGEGVAYDVPNNASQPQFMSFIKLLAQVFLEQKKMLKYGLSIAHYKRYIPLIEEETREYFKRWGPSGEQG